MAKWMSCLSQAAMISPKRRRSAFFLSARASAFADQVAQARLAVEPFTVQGITVADQDTFPVLDQLLERFLGPVRINAIEGDPFVDHGPQPVQVVFFEPGGFVDVVAPEAAGDPADVCVYRTNCF